MPEVMTRLELAQRHAALTEALQALLVETRTWIKPDDAEANPVWRRAQAVCWATNLLSDERNLTDGN